MTTKAVLFENEWKRCYDWLLLIIGNHNDKESFNTLTSSL